MSPSINGIKACLVLSRPVYHYFIRFLITALFMIRRVNTLLFHNIHSPARFDLKKPSSRMLNHREKQDYININIQLLSQWHKCNLYNSDQSLGVFFNKQNTCLRHAICRRDRVYLAQFSLISFLKLILRLCQLTHVAN